MSINDVAVNHPALSYIMPNLSTNTPNRTSVRILLAIPVRVYGGKKIVLSTWSDEVDERISSFLGEWPGMFFLSHNACKEHHSFIRRGKFSFVVSVDNNFLFVIVSFAPLDHWIVYMVYGPCNTDQLVILWHQISRIRILLVTSFSWSPFILSPF